MLSNNAVRQPLIAIFDSLALQTDISLTLKACSAP
jgi:hypothetical protein